VTATRNQITFSYATQNGYKNFIKKLVYQAMVQTEKWIRIKIKLYNLCTRPMAHANMKLSHSQAKKTQDGADLHFLSPQPDTSLHCRETTDMVHSAVCLFTSQLSLVLTVSTHRGMARLS